MALRLGIITINKVHKKNRHCKSEGRSNPGLKLSCIALFLLVLCSCSKFETKTNAKALRLGYLLNISHAVPIVGLESQSLTNVEAQYFSSGGYLLNALITKNLDIAYIGPGPYLNALNKGIKLKLLALSSSGANSLILSDQYQNDEDFKIKRLAVPQLGNTQDLLAKYLVSNIKAHKTRYKKLSPEMRELVELPTIKFATRLEYIAVDPAELETVFFTGDVDAALVAEPWGTLLEDKGYINLNKLATNAPYNLVHELEGSRDSFIYQQLNLINEFPAALLVVDEDFYNKNTELVDNFVKEQSVVLEFIQSDKARSVIAIQRHLQEITKKTIAEEFIATSFDKLRFGGKLDMTKLAELKKVAKDYKYIRSEN